MLSKNSRPIEKQNCVSFDRETKFTCLTVTSVHTKFGAKLAASAKYFILAAAAHTPETTEATQPRALTLHPNVVSRSRIAPLTHGPSKPWYVELLLVHADMNLVTKDPCGIARKALAGSSRRSACLSPEVGPLHDDAYRWSPCLFN